MKIRLKKQVAFDHLWLQHLTIRQGIIIIIVVVVVVIIIIIFLFFYFYFFALAHSFLQHGRIMVPKFKPLNVRLKFSMDSKLRGLDITIPSLYGIQHNFITLPMHFENFGIFMFLN